MAGVNPSTALARVLVDEMVAGGVTDIVLAPGSRNAPLSMAVHAADTSGRVRLHLRIDERTAGFLALGLARGSGRPVAVITTSGTAVANLHPAVLEAHHGAVPLLVVSADRPPELRDVGANQVVDQRALFGPALRFFHEFGVAQRVPGQNAGWRAMVCRGLAAASGAGGLAGPVQLNVSLADPLMPGAALSAGATQTASAAEPTTAARPAGLGPEDWPESLAGRDGPWTTVTGADPALGPAVPATEPGERVLFLADLTHPWAGTVARAGHLVISEAGGAAGSAVLGAGVHLLAAGDFLDQERPERVIVLGRPTLFRPVQRLLADPRVCVDVIAHPASYADPSGRARYVAAGWPDLRGAADEDWSRRWRAADAAAGRAVHKVIDELDINASPRLARDLVRALPPRATLLLGSSQSPRDLALTAAPRDGLRVLANRGVAGIDGTVSTAVGVALAADPDDGPTVALVGDLTPARHHGPGHRSARAAAGPRDRGEQQRRRRDLLDPGAGGAATCGSVRAGVRDSARCDVRRPGGRCRRGARPCLDGRRTPGRRRGSGRDPGRGGADVPHRSGVHVEPDDPRGPRRALRRLRAAASAGSASATLGTAPVPIPLPEPGSGNASRAGRTTTRRRPRRPDGPN